VRGVPHDDQKRAAVVAALLEGQSVSQIARDYSISKSSVIAWREAAGLHSTPVEPQKRDEIGALVAGVLRSNLAAVQLLAEHASDPEWFRKHNAADIAVLSGVLTDKAIRILEALESADPPATLDAGVLPDTASE
jgi:transposase-like protein